MVLVDSSSDCLVIVNMMFLAEALAVPPVFLGLGFLVGEVETAGCWSLEETTTSSKATRPAEIQKNDFSERNHLFSIHYLLILIQISKNSSKKLCYPS